MLKKGEVLAFKTDTVWGFGAHPDDSVAIKKIYEIKKRDAAKPLILMSYDFEHLKKYIQNIPPYAYDLIEKYLPGGLTLIFEKSKCCSFLVTSNKNTVGIRIPKCDDFINLVKKIDGGVLATTSCNISNESPVISYTEAVDKFENCATVIKPTDDKNIEKNIPSTIILCEKDNYKILRQGAVKL